MSQATLFDIGIINFVNELRLAQDYKERVVINEVVVNKKRLIRIVLWLLPIIIIFVGGYFFFWQIFPGNKLYLSRDEIKIEAQQAFLDSQKVDYYNLGRSVSKIGRLYVPISGFDANQNPIFLDLPVVFSAKLGSGDYSDFWSVNYVILPIDSKTDYAKSETEIKSKGLEIKPSELTVNQPQVKEGSDIDSRLTVNSGWAEGDSVQSIFFSGDIQVDTHENGIKSSKAYFMVRGFKKTKDYIKVIGQKDIIFSSTGGFSPLRELFFVLVPSNYPAGQLTSEQQILDSHYRVEDGNLMFNMPISGEEALSSTNIGANQNINLNQNSNIGSNTNDSNSNINSGGQANGQNEFPEEPNPDASSNAGDRNRETEGQNDNTSSPPAENQSINIIEVDFESGKVIPDHLEIPLNTSVIWVNRGAEAHLIASDKSGIFRSNPMGKDIAFKVDFIRPGIYNYHCEFHPAEKGTIIVGGN